MDRYVKVKSLGKGSFGSATLVRRKADGELLVVKEVNLSRMNPKERQEAKQEVIMMQKLHHPNIVQFVEHFERRGSLFIIMEYADGGDLHQKIKAQRSTRMKEESVMHYFCQISLALEYLHSKHILHRDIKAMNVFLTSNGTVKLGDFGISTVLRNTMGMANTVCGTPYYFSPELCKNKPYNNKSDVWAVGVLLYEMATLRHPFDGSSMQQLMKAVVRGTYTPLPPSFSPELKDLVAQCLRVDPSKRPTVKAVLQIPIMRKAMEKLEKDLMTATATKVRLQNVAEPQAEPKPQQPSRAEPQKQAAAQRGDKLAPKPSAVVRGAVRQPPPQPIVVAQHTPAATPTPKHVNGADKIQQVNNFIQHLARPQKDVESDALRQLKEKREADRKLAQQQATDAVKAYQAKKAADAEKAKLELARARAAMQALVPGRAVPSPSKAAAAPSTPGRGGYSPQPYVNPITGMPMSPGYGVPAVPRHVQELKSPQYAQTPTKVVETPRKQQRLPVEPSRQVPADAKSPRNFPVAPAQKPIAGRRAERKPSEDAVAPPPPAQPAPEVRAPRERIAEAQKANANNWVQKESDRKRMMLDQKLAKRKEEEKRAVAALDKHVLQAKIKNRVLDPELEAWIEKDDKKDKLGPKPQRQRNAGDETPPHIRRSADEADRLLRQQGVPVSARQPATNHRSGQAGTTPVKDSRRNHARLDRDVPQPFQQQNKLVRSNNPTPVCETPEAPRPSSVSPSKMWARRDPSKFHPPSALVDVIEDDVGAPLPKGGRGTLQYKDQRKQSAPAYLSPAKVGVSPAKELDSDTRFQAVPTPAKADWMDEDIQECFHEDNAVAVNKRKNEYNEMRSHIHTLLSNHNVAEEIPDTVEEEFGDLEPAVVPLHATLIPELEVPEEDLPHRLSGLAGKEFTGERAMIRGKPLFAVHDSDMTPQQHAEVLRQYLEEQLGFMVFFEAYQLFSDEALTDEEVGATAQRMLAKDKQRQYIQLLAQLVYFDDVANRA